MTELRSMKLLAISIGCSVCKFAYYECVQLVSSVCYLLMGGTSKCAYTMCQYPRQLGVSTSF